jgi:hypothetical protein
MLAQRLTRAARASILAETKVLDLLGSRIFAIQSYKTMRNNKGLFVLISRPPLIEGIEFLPATCFITCKQKTYYMSNNK